MAPVSCRLVAATLAFASTPAAVSAQNAGDEAGSITTIDAKSGLVTVAATGQPTQRFYFVVTQAALGSRLRPGLSVTVNLKTATGQLGGQTLRVQSVLTQVAVTPKVRTAMLCSTLQAAMNAAHGDVPPGIPTVLWSCRAEPVAGSNQYWCRCAPQFSF